MPFEIDAGEVLNITLVLSVGDGVWK